MWLTLRMAWRNLWRNRRRSILTMIAVILPVFFLNIMWGMSGALERNFFENATELETGHIQIHEADYRDLRNVDPIINQIEPVLDVIEGDSGVEWYTVRLDIPAIASNGNRSRGVLVQGIEPEQSQEISLIDEWISRGRMLTAEDTKNAVLGDALMRHLNVDLGQDIILLTSHPQAGTGVLRPNIVGAIEPPVPDISRAVVQIPIADARSLVKNQNAATSVVIRVAGVTGPWDQSKIDETAARIQQILGEEYLVETWKKISPELVTMIEMLRPLYMGFALIFFLISGLIVLNTFYLSILERTRELGVALAVGCSRGRIVRWIEGETIVLAGIGALIGSLLGILIVSWGSGGIALPEFYKEMLSDMGMSTTLHMRMTWAETLISAVLMFVFALVAAAYPSWKASRLEPVEAIRFRT